MRTWSGRPGAQVPLAALIAATLVASVVTVIVRAQDSGRDPRSAGDLAPLLAAQRSAEIAAIVAPADRGVLNQAHLQAAWRAAVAAAGPFRRVTRTVTVDEDVDRVELEVLSFDHGAGTLTARRTAGQITEMWLLIGTRPDAAAAKLGATYSEELVSGQLAQLQATFDAHMTAGLPSDHLAAVVAAAIAGLQPPATVGGQVVISRPGYVVVETYLLFSNGLRRIEITFDSDMRVAGLYIRNI